MFSSPARAFGWCFVLQLVTPSIALGAHAEWGEVWALMGLVGGMQLFLPLCVGAAAPRLLAVITGVAAFPIARYTGWNWALDAFNLGAGAGVGLGDVLADAIALGLGLVAWLFAHRGRWLGAGPV